MTKRTQIEVFSGRSLLIRMDSRIVSETADAISWAHGYSPQIVSKETAAFWCKASEDVERYLSMLPIDGD